MFIAEFDIKNDPKLGPKLKDWTGRLNIAAKKEGAPTFEVSGPEQLRCRMRRGGQMVTQERSFMGGEVFRVSNILLEKQQARKGVEILAILTPVDLTLAGEISTVSMPLDKAVETFTGLAAWVDTSLIEPAATPPAPGAVHVPTVAETRSSAKWGAW